MKHNEGIIGKTVDIIVDRPLGSRHPKHKELLYPVNYGYVAGVMGGDGEEQDVYLLGVDAPVSRFRAEVIAVIHRLDDVEDKWVAAFQRKRHQSADGFSGAVFSIGNLSLK